MELAKDPESDARPVMLMPPRTTVPDCAAAEIKYEGPYVAFIVFRSSIFPNK